MCKLDKIINADSEFIIWIILLYSRDGQDDQGGQGGQGGQGDQGDEGSLLEIWYGLESYHDI